jgi:hypothetical protein
MNHQALQAMASQKISELREAAAAQRRERTARTQVPQQSLRVRTGWTLVDVGLRLVGQPAGRPASAPRPTGS